MKAVQGLPVRQGCLHARRHIRDLRHNDVRIPRRRCRRRRGCRHGCRRHDRRSRARTPLRARCEDGHGPRAPAGHRARAVPRICGHVFAPATSVGTAGTVRWATTRASSATSASLQGTTRDTTRGSAWCRVPGAAHATAVIQTRGSPAGSARSTAPRTTSILGSRYRAHSGCRPGRCAERPRGWWPRRSATLH